MNLRPYQEMMVEHIIRSPRNALWADMGLGKTVTTLTALEYLDSCEDVFPALVLAPKRVATDVWPVETMKWAHLKNLSVAVCVGTPKQRMAALKAKAQITVMNYDNLVWLSNVTDKWPYKTVVADESTRLKGFRTRQGGARAGKLAKVAAQSRRFIELTGTPSPNGLEDLWGQAWFLDFGERLGKTYSAFQQRWFRSDYFGYTWTPMPHAFDEITGLLQDVCLRVRAEDYFPVDKPVVNNVYVDLPPKARQHYRELEKTMFTELNKVGVEAFNAAALTQKCSQFANGAAYTDKKGNWEWVHDAKIEALQSVVEETGGDPLLVAYYYKSDLQRLSKAFPKAKTIEDAGVIEDWNAGKVPMLLVHPASAGHGLNLQYGGHRLVFFGLTWNLEHYLQVIERIGPARQKSAGFDRSVFVTHILAQDTIDERMLSVVEGKATFQTAIGDAMRRYK